MLHILDRWRESHPHIVADIEAALLTQPAATHPLMDVTDDDEFLKLVAELSPNLHKFVMNNRDGTEESSVRAEFQRLNFCAHHFERTIEEMNKLPSDSPFVQLSRLMSKLLQWAYADMEI